jgi:hypothetical protein
MGRWISQYSGYDRPYCKSRTGYAAERLSGGLTRERDDASHGIAPLAGWTLREHYWIALTMSKIGRYMATTMPPTMTPSTTIMTGSIRDSSALTATSTSAS